MFEQTFVQTQAQMRKPWTVIASLSVQCGIVAVLLLIPLLHPEALRMPELPKPLSIRTWVTLPPIPVQPAAANTSTVTALTPVRPVFYPSPNDRNTPARRVDVPSVDGESTPWQGPATTELPFGATLSLANALPPRAVPPPALPQPSTKTTATGPVKVGGDVESAKLLFGPHPAYPALAITVHSQGVVRLEAIIAANGTIRNLRILSGPPLLVTAARDAVMQWRYQPTLLNGVAVEVVTEIEVNFTLGK